MSSSSSPYAPAARLLGSIWESKKSLKTLAYDKKGTLIIAKSTYAQVCHVLESKNQLDAVLKVIKVDCRNAGLLYVLLYELLLGPNKKIRGGGALKRQLLEKESQLRAVMDQCETPKKTPVVVFPRYVRVNTLLSTVQSVYKWMKEKYPHSDIYLDPHVPNLLVLPPKTALHDLVTLGKVVLQDKSSCFSALCLGHVMGDCLDACAAPGNKTSHLCMLLNSDNNGNTNKKWKVVACDRNKTRLEMMIRRLTPLLPLPTMMEAKLCDFLTTKPEEYPSVKGILLDPSCSGSGMFTSQDHRHSEIDDDDDQTMIQRIKTLSNFQVTALKHAMSFPQVTNLVYSTCSIHDQENEHVVRQALLEYGKDWELVAPPALQAWNRRGRLVAGLTPQQVACLVRADVDDATNGFFVAYFERRSATLSKTAAPRVRQIAVVEAVEGLEFYRGQLETPQSTSDISVTKVSTKVVEPTTMKQEKENAEASKSSMSKPTPQPTQVKAEPMTKNPQKTEKNKKHSHDKVLVKKAAKKQAWKQRQMGQKKIRLLKRTVIDR